MMKGWKVAIAGLFAFVFLAVLPTYGKAETLVPELILPDPYYRPPNSIDLAFDPDKLRPIDMWWQNAETIRIIVADDSDDTQQILYDRIEDSSQPMVLRLFYSGILAVWGDKSGQEFLLKTGTTSTEQEEIKFTFWILGHLKYFQPVEEIDTKPVDMHWAEEFMLSMLDGVNVQLAMCADFPIILAEMKSSKLFPILAKRLEEMRPQQCNESVIGALGILGDQRAVPLLLGALKNNENSMERHHMARALGNLGNQQAVPFLLELLKQHKDDCSVPEFMGAAIALAQLNCNDAVPVLLERLDDHITIEILTKFKDDRILPALKTALPSADKRVQDHIRLNIFKLEDGDRLPKLIELAEHSDESTSIDAMDAICDLKDIRAVPFAVKMLNNSQYFHVRIAAIFILKEFSDSPEAIKGLINGLDIDFRVFEKGEHTIKEEIPYYLKKMTGQDFGTDKAKWLAWYEEKYGK